MQHNNFVLTYTTNQIDLAPLKDQPIRDASRAVRLLRANARKYKLRADQLFVCGFSAGGHLTGSLAVHWQDIAEKKETLTGYSNKPTGVILSYPVITSGKFAHRDSFVALCGNHASQEELAYYSLETQVSHQTPPVFLWQTVEDEVVPVENSMLMASALRRAGISFEYHLFPHGSHGLSLSNEVWEKGDLGKPYTLEQMIRLKDAVRRGELVLPEEEKRELLGEDSEGKEKDEEQTRQDTGVAIKEVAIWPELALAWMKALCLSS